MLGLAGAVLAAAVLAAVLTPNLFGPGGGPEETGRPKASATAAATATPSPTPTFTPIATAGFDIGELSPPVADEVRRWWEACDTKGQPPPVDVADMNKKDAEDALKPYREACEEGGG